MIEPRVRRRTRDRSRRQSGDEDFSIIEAFSLTTDFMETDIFFMKMLEENTFGQRLNFELIWSSSKPYRLIFDHFKAEYAACEII